MENSKTILEVKNLIKKFTLNNSFIGTNKEITAIDNLSFKLDEGETVGLLGHNGAGKTTLIHMLINAIKPTSGSIFYFSQDFFCNTSKILRDISFASTYISLPKELTVQENLDIFARIYGLSKSERIYQIDKYLKVFDMSFYRHKKTEILSQGLMTKLILIKAFITKPKVVFLDEPTSSLDQNAAAELREFIQFEQKQNKITIILASHNMHEINQLCNRIIILKNGKIINDYLQDRSIELFYVKLNLITDQIDEIKKFAQAKQIFFEIKQNCISLYINEDFISLTIKELIRSGIFYKHISIDKISNNNNFIEKEFKENS